MARACSIFFLFVFVSVISVGAEPFQTAPAAKAGKPGGTINLNTATAADLETLPGIGAKVAARIVEYRTQKGPFKKVEELMNVPGVGQKSFLKLKPQLSVGERVDTPARR